MPNQPSRRQFIQHSALTGAALMGVSATALAGDHHHVPATRTGSVKRPAVDWGLQIGDVHGDGALLWSRTDRPARLIVEWSKDERFRRAVRVEGPVAGAETDFTARVDLQGLPSDAQVFVRAYFENWGFNKSKSEAVTGRFRTPARAKRDIRFVWTGDTAGQGWGIDLGFGGFKAYEAMRRARPDFFVHSGDNIYADGPLLPEVKDAAGNVIWTNAYLDAVPEKLKVAETLHEFRRHHLYNRYDEHVRRFTAEVPQIWQWDDHEITNNWSPSKELDSRYTVVPDIATLVANGSRAFREYAPIRFGRGDDHGRIYRKISYGADLDLFVLDARSYRAGNSANVQPKPSGATAFFGPTQVEWLKRNLKQSRATWKVILNDMPIGLVVPDGTDASGLPRHEGSSNGDGPALGREFELADILRFIKRSRIKNTLWLTADVHYTAAHYYDPSVAVFRDFDPFWEFVSGPIHAGTFGPNPLDNTFGPTVIYEKTPGGVANLPPTAGLQFFGQVDIDHRTKRLTVTLKDLAGTALFSQELEEGARF